MNHDTDVNTLKINDYVTVYVELFRIKTDISSTHYKFYFARLKNALNTLRHY